MRIVFCGTPEFGVPTLRRLLASPEFSVEAVVTQPDRPRGRGQRISASAVKEVAAEAGALIYQPESVKADAAFDFFSQIKPDAVVIIAYGQIIPRRLLEIPRLGWMNLHASLLPKYRGAAPIAWAIANGEAKTGLTTMRVDPGLDTGPILMQRELEIGRDETAPELSGRMAELGAPLVLESLIQVERAEIQAIPQDSSQATYAPLLTKEQGHIHWTQTADEIYNRIRGLAPWPGGFSTLRGRLCHIWGRPCARAAEVGQDVGSMVVNDAAIDVVCGNNTLLRLDAVQMEGRKRISAQEFAHGARLRSGQRFDD
jgi:methionyl-tRNA formyltransferase